MKKILEYSFKNKLKHIPSALSQYAYLKHLLPKLKNFKLVIGKPFGAQAYYCIWQDMYKLPAKLGYGVKHDELDFIEYGEETIGNALGIASGIAVCQDKPVYCNISDGCFQMGPTQEAIQFIGHHKQDVFLTVDCNEFQLTGSTTDILGITAEKMAKHFELYGWNVKVIDTLENAWHKNISALKSINKLKMPYVIIFKTKKGQGVPIMEENPQEWHYKEIGEDFVNTSN